MWLAVRERMRSIAVAAFLVGLTTVASAEQITGRVVDKKRGAPVEGAVVYVTGPGGFERSLATDADGRYAVDVTAGKYSVSFLHGRSRVGGQVVVEPGADVRLDGRVENVADEVIVLEHTRPPTVMPQPRDLHVATKAPPYSDRAVLEDAWTRAWLLLDVDERGTVTRLKLLNKPGYDLEDIAIAQGFALSFKPGRDERDRPVRTLLVWPIEWVANSWLLTIGTGMRSRMPAKSRLTDASSAAYVPCKGSGPWKMTAVWHGYRDCSRPDLSKVSSAPWILPPSDAAAR